MYLSLYLSILIILCQCTSTPIIACLSLYNIHISIYPLLSPLITPITLINLSVLILLINL